MSSRRNFLRTAVGGMAVLGYNTLTPTLARASDIPADPHSLPAGARESAVLSSLSGKQALIKRTYRPPNYETPLGLFDAPFTPNDRFFVRYHMGSIPTLRLAEWKLTISGDAVSSPREYTLAELKERFELVELPALCFCAGNRRGLVDPHVPGIQWGYGAMGNAMWRGVRLGDVLAQSRLSKDALEITFGAADGGVLPSTPDFAKSLPLAKALDQNTLIAFDMNGEPLPHWNGFPARLVVPGWAATYWIKHLTTITAVTKPFDGFWMKNAYRVPTGLFPGDHHFPSQRTDSAAPITELLVNSLVTHPTDGQRYEYGRPINLQGFAWDGGQGIERVEVSIDHGRTWRLALLGKDYGPLAWRPWSYTLAPPGKGSCPISVRATDRSGRTQGAAPIRNPSGYHHNAIQEILVHIA